MVLNVHSYNTAENDAISSFGNRIIEANSPVTFQLSGYPSSVSSDDQLWRFVDAMHELGEKKTYEHDLNGLTIQEFILFKKISKAIFNITKEQYGKPILPKGALLKAFVALRYIRSISSPEETTILEIGPGSGYLGALLALDGYRYIATDIAQGFYIHQSIFWEYLFGENLIELALVQQNLDEINEIEHGTVLHIPWWKYSTDCPEKINLPVNFVVSNHAMCEMHRSAFGYNLNIAHGWLSRSKTPKFFIVEGGGADRVRRYDEMCYGFEKAGFTSVAKHSAAEIFTPAKYTDSFSKVAQTNHPQAITNGKHLQTSENAPSPSQISEVVRLLKNSHATLSSKGGIKFFLTKVQSYLLGTSMPVRIDQTIEKDISQSDGFLNWFEESLHKKISALENEQKVSFDEMRDFQYKLMGSNDIYTEDEKFLQFAYGTEDWS